MNCGLSDIVHIVYNKNYSQPTQVCKNCYECNDLFVALQELINQDYNQFIIKKFKQINMYELNKYNQYALFDII